MKQRCRNPKDPSYPRYGGAGISVCERWAFFENFLADMGTRPAGTTLDRIDPSGNYEPGNCRWATAAEQQQNRRSSIFVGEVLEKAIRLRQKGWNYQDISAHFGASRGSAWHALKKVRGL